MASLFRCISRSLLFRYFLSLSLIYLPTAHANNPESVRPAKPVYWQRERVIADYKKIHNPGEFAKYFLNNRSPEERFQFHRKIALAGGLPRIERAGNGIRLSKSGVQLEIDISQGEENIFVIGGHRITVNPHESLTQQAEDLQKLLISGQGHASLMRLLIPEAQAVPALIPVVYGALAFIGMGLVNKIMDRYSTNFLEVLDWEFCSRWVGDPDETTNPKMCKDYIKEKAEMMKKAPENSAVKNALQDSSSQFGAFSTVNEKCQFESKTKNYHSLVKILREDPNSKKITESQARILGEFIDDQLKKIQVFEVDSDNPAASKPLATYVVDQNALLTDIVLPNPSVKVAEVDSVRKLKLHQQLPPEKNAKKANSLPSLEEPTVVPLVPSEVKISSSAELKENPEMEALRKFHQGIFAYVGERLAVCRVKKKEADAVKMFEKNHANSATSGAQKTKSQGNNPR